MATTYISSSDLDYVLNGFVNRYYGTRIDDDPDTITTETAYYTDMHHSYDETNEILMGITHIKSVPIGTQADGNYPLHVRKLQSYLMVYNRLISRHYGEFTDDIPGWINVYRSRANEVENDIVHQRVVFDENITQGEQGIGVGTWVGTKAGAARLYTNWETGTYTYPDYPKIYRIEIDGTGSGNGIGTATFKWSDNNGIAYGTTAVTTATHWLNLEYGLQIRWEAVGTSNQCELGDNFSVTCNPLHYGVKGGGIRFVTFERG